METLWLAAPEVSPVQWFQTVATVQLGALVGLLFQAKAFELPEGERPTFPNALEYAQLLSVVLGLAGLVAALHAIRVGGSEVTELLVRFGLGGTIPILFLRPLTRSLRAMRRPGRMLDVLELILPLVLAMSIYVGL